MPRKTTFGKAKQLGEFVVIFDKICATLDKYKDSVLTFTKESARVIRLRLHGKQIAIIGPVAAGKTTLLHVLREPNISVDPMTYEKTTDAVVFADRLQVKWNLPLEGSRKKAEVVRLKVRKPKDVGGEASQRDTQTGWSDVCTGSDFIFYVFDASTFAEKHLHLRIGEDFNWIADNNQAFAPGFKIIILANKIDKLLDDKDRLEIFQQQLPSIEEATRDALGPFAQHLALIAPCCLLSPKHRTTAISLALKHIAELA
jgi:GTPase SAR1 family protein